MYTTHEREVVIGWANWLNTMNWHFFSTFSTAYPLSANSARKAMERLYSLVKLKYGDARIFWVAEPFDSKYGYHTHALVHFNNPMENSKELLNKAWQTVTKGKGGKEYNHTVLMPYDKSLGANYYILKYMTRNNAGYDILGETNSLIITNN